MVLRRSARPAHSVRTHRLAAAVTAVVTVAIAAATLAVIAPRDPSIVLAYTGPTIASVPTTTAVIPQPTVPPTTVTTLPAPDIGRAAIPEPGPAVGLKIANGRPYQPAIEFRSTIPIPDDLVFVLVLGSDARPNENMLKTRADSIHLVAVNPRSGQGTIVGFPRDSYVQFPNGGRGKINDALARGGPTYVAETVRQLTGLPIHYVVVTGFVGFQRMVDELGGLDMHVDRRMNDRMSGARFQPGWHHFVGGEALAYARNRNDVPYGDFSRSENHGALLLAGLAKLRAEVADDPNLLRWIDVLRRHARVDVPPDHLPRLAALARRVAPERMTNVVLPGRVGYAGKASVVFLTQDAPRLFEDLRADAVIGAAAPPVGATSTVPPTTSAPPTTSTSVPPVTTTSTTSTTRPLVDVEDAVDD
ncbi:MAG TPA: LCP family protein [Acidimicrobiales bacterium]|nr:LCP family protein [Acidimicrobiales bacterium]